MTREEAMKLDDDTLMRLLASKCGIYTESQLRTFFRSLCLDINQTMTTYGFGEVRNNDIVLNERGIIASEVVDRFMKD